MIGDSAFSLLAAIVGRDLSVSMQPYLMMDRQFLKRTAVPGVEYVWVFRDQDTHLWMVGIHQRYMNQAREQLTSEMGYRAFHLRVAATGKVHVAEISIGQAKRLMSIQALEVDGDTVFRAGALIGRFSLTIQRMELGCPIVGIDLHSFSSEQSDLIALRLIAECEAVDYCGTTAFRIDRVKQHHVMLTAA